VKEKREEVANKEKVLGIQTTIEIFVGIGSKNSKIPSVKSLSQGRS
jgi:hypothetical protein